MTVIVVALFAAPIVIMLIGGVRAVDRRSLKLWLGTLLVALAWIGGMALPAAILPGA